MMQAQQISLFNLNSRPKFNNLLGKQLKPEIDKTENLSPELINPFFFLGLSVYVDLFDEIRKSKAEYVLKVTGAQIISSTFQKEKIFDADVIVTDKEEYRNQQFLNQKSGSIYVETQIDPFLGFGSQKRQISTTNKKKNSIIISPEQIPWAFITEPLQNDQKTEPNHLGDGFAQNWLNDGPLLPPSLPQSRTAMVLENQQTESFFLPPNMPDEKKSKKSRSGSRKNKILNNQKTLFSFQTQKIEANNPASTSITSSPYPNFTGGLIVVADSTMRSAPNFCYLHSMPEIRLKPLPDGVQFISPFVNDENIAKLCKERSESLRANSNICNNATITFGQKTEKKEPRKKKATKDGGRSNAAACRYCGICKKSVTDEEKHKMSIEHKQNVLKQFQQVDELIECFSNFPSSFL